MTLNVTVGLRPLSLLDLSLGLRQAVAAAVLGGLLVLPGAALRLAEAAEIDDLAGRRLERGHKSYERRCVSYPLPGAPGSPTHRS